jgi:hypothetical protein
MFLLLVVFGLLAALAIGMAWKRKNYWKERGVGGPGPILFWGNLDLLGNQVDNQQPLILQK